MVINNFACNDKSYFSEYQFIKFMLIMININLYQVKKA